VSRVKAAAIATIILFLILGLSSLIPLEASEAEALMRELESLMEEPLEVGILINNSLITLTSFIPFAGPCVMGYVIVHTGRFLGWLAGRLQISPLILISFSILGVYGLLEFLAYGLAVAESSTISYYILRERHRLKGEFEVMAACILIAMLLLAAAAVIEAALTRLLTMMGGQIPFTPG